MDLEDDQRLSCTHRYSFLRSSISCSRYFLNRLWVSSFTFRAERPTQELASSQDTTLCQGCSIFPSQSLPFSPPFTLISLIFSFYLFHSTPKDLLLPSAGPPESSPVPSDTQIVSLLCTQL